MFAIGDRRWPGISKLVEECGEVIQVCGKLMGKRGNVEHWSGDMREKLHEELGDLMAAIAFVTEHCGLDQTLIAKRASEKLKTFKKWHATDKEPVKGSD